MGGRNLGVERGGSMGIGTGRGYRGLGVDGCILQHHPSFIHGVMALCHGKSMELDKSRRAASF